MVAKIFSFTLVGIESHPIEIEIDIQNGLPVVNIVGLPDNAVKESRERVRAAIKNSGFEFPNERITVNLAPADIKKEGSLFDLPIALGILCASNQMNKGNLEEFTIVGELALDGNIRPVKGILPIASGIKIHNKLIVPHENAKEAAIINSVKVFPVKNLLATINLLNEPEKASEFKTNIKELFNLAQDYDLDFEDVKGQNFAKRAIEIAVAGNHNILLIGPPGSGKTMLAKRIPTIMPQMTFEEALETTRIHSVMGMVLGEYGVVATRPFRAPHHTASNIALVGGGSDPTPGEISLAHNGVLFMDELPEFHRDVLEVLRQPLEDGAIRISRVNRSVSFPARFMLVCAMNPCPCGYYSDPKKNCRCTPNKIQTYMSKVSGPLLDRIDIHIEVPSLSYKEISSDELSESSAIIKGRIERARSIQRKRFSKDSIFTNSQMTHKLIKKFCTISQDSKDLLKLAIDELGFSARAHDKILKVARTIADLAGCENIKPEHLSEAVQYRSLNRDL